MKSGEKNLLFCAVFIFFLLVVVGLRLVDANLTRMIVPDTPFATFSLRYEHGFVLVGSGEKHPVPSLALVNLRTGASKLSICRGRGELVLPLYLNLGEIKGLRGLLAVDKLLP